MEHVKALAIKGVMTLVVLFLVLTLAFDISFWHVLLLTIVLGFVSYILGDLMILPKTSNMTATMADLGMAFLVIWLYGLALINIDGSTMAWAALISAVVMAIGEYFFHNYILKKDLGTDNRYETSSDH